MIGTTLSHFKITAKLGEGGMGEVYRAEDSKLGREVAIKVLPEAVATDPERLARFEREAKVLASLNHPSIAAIHSIESATAGRLDEEERTVYFLVMELVEGEDLSEQLARGPIPMDEALPIALQIAEGMEAAHEKGIIHRDLKPANVKVTPDGRVKVLDFGLAKALTAGTEAGAPEGRISVSMSPTLTAQMTQAGVLMGTAAYMSPEQARGKEVDKRADIWAFGCVLYEMVTGQKGFAGDTVSDTLAAVLTRDLDLDQLPESTPPSIQRLLARCLDKDARSRLRDIGEARIAIEAALAGEEIASSEVVGSAPIRKGLVPIVVSLSIAAVAIAAYLGWNLKPSPELPLRKFDLQATDLQVNWIRHPKISPDGTKVLYADGRTLWIRDLRTVEATEISESIDSNYFCWSPDSRQIAFVSETRIWRAAILGGTATQIAVLPSDIGGSGSLVWAESGQIMITGGNDTGILEVSEKGGNFKEIAPLDQTRDRDFHEMELLPDGQGLVYVVHRKDPDGKRRIVDTIEVFDYSERRVVLQLEGESLVSVAYSPSGHLLFHRSTTAPGVWAVPFSLSTLETTGDPFLVAADSWLPSTSEDGSLLMVHGLATSVREIVEVDRQGNVLRSFGQVAGEVEAPDLSPDGKKLLFTALDNGNWDLWIYSIDQQGKSRLTFDTTFDSHGRWSPSGKEILYAVPDSDQVRIRLADGSEEARTVAVGNSPDWLPDGSGFVFERFSSESESWDIYLGMLDGSDAVPLLVSPANEGAAAVSPDGRYLAYSSDETGQSEIYIQEFPAASSKWQVSLAGGIQPVWRPDGSEIFYVQDGNMMAVEILDIQPVTFGRPQTLFSFSTSSLNISSVGIGEFAVGLDGDTLIVGRAVADSSHRAKLVLIQNWYSEFEPANR